MPMPIETMYVVVPYRGYLAALKMMGPIVHPIRAEKSAVAAMLMSGVEVHEYNLNTKMTTKLTLESLTGSVEEVPVIDPPQQTTILTGAPVAPPVEAPVVAAPADEYIDEKAIDWNALTKKERRELRAKLDAQKAAEAATAETTPEEESTDSSETTDTEITESAEVTAE